jgi:BirA family biotin operon repressor/biotin-[acetyl-CoA-carboxylase] ligase
VIPFAGGVLDPGLWPFFENVACLGSVRSSNDLARELIELYLQEEQTLPPTLILAEEQPGARGRSGRRWHAPAGRGIYATLIRRMGRREPLSLVPIAVARWLRDGLFEVARVASELKWPNDLYARGRKLGGVLAEARTQGEETYIAVGFGINVQGSAASLGVAGATTVEEEAGRAVEVAPLVQRLAERLGGELAVPRWEREVELWERASVHRRGDRLTVRRNGEEKMGEYLGLDASGFLRLRTPAGEEVFANGELASW